jgi:D-glycero-D-manno-heptose 1,7-bisphosphate phosphatase
MKLSKEWTLFLDRDGVINVKIDGEYIHDTKRLEVREDFWHAAPILFSMFGRRIVVTNQQGIDKGLCTAEQVAVVHQYMQELLADKGLRLDAIYCCPHRDGAGCGCRKPDTGMALMAQRDFPEIDFSKSVMIGDSLTDVMFGRRCGMTTVLLHAQGEVSVEEKENADYIVPSLMDFVKLVS